MLIDESSQYYAIRCIPLSERLSTCALRVMLLGAGLFVYTEIYQVGVVDRILVVM